MANVKKGQLTPPPEWWKHLRWAKKKFWGAERQAEKIEILNLSQEDQELVADLVINPPPASPALVKAAKGPKKRFGMEYRYTQEACDYFGKGPSFLERNKREWRPYFRWYETAKRRDQAMERLSREKFLDKCVYHEYRPIER